MPEYSFTVNGEDVTVDTPGNVGALYVLRDRLGYTGPKYGCGVGVCRACTCHVDGAEFQPCITPMSEIDGRDITTIEGLAENGTLHPLQQAWIDFDVAQCGFCQPGQIMTACAMMNAKGGAALTDDEIDSIENVCRCGTYHRIRQAIKAVGDGAVTTVTRLAGDTRVDTAAAISRDLFAAGTAPAAVLARADNFPDALSGSTLAMARGGPLLLTDPGTLSRATRVEIQRALVPGSTVTILGGISALSPQIERDIEDAGFTVERIGGQDRQETAAAIAEALPTPETIFVASGDDFGEALIASAAAARQGGITLLTNVNGLDSRGQTMIDNNPSAPVFVVGQGAASTESGLGQVIAGGNVFETAVLVAQRFNQGLQGVGLAGSQTFADALAGAVHAARNNLAVLLTEQNNLPPSVRDHLAATGGDLTIYGGDAAISDIVARQAQDAINGG